MQLCLTFFVHHESPLVHVLPRVLEAASFPKDLKLKVLIGIEAVPIFSIRADAKQMEGTFSESQQWPIPPTPLQLSNEHAKGARLNVSVSASFLGADASAEGLRSEREHMDETRRIIKQLTEASSESLEWWGRDGKQKAAWEVAAAKGLPDDICKMLMPSRPEFMLKRFVHACVCCWRIVASCWRAAVWLRYLATHARCLWQKGPVSSTSRSRHQKPAGAVQCRLGGRPEDTCRKGLQPLAGSQRVLHTL